jgi:hypothetical protein
MNTSHLGGTLSTLFGELVDGLPERGGYVLNRDDAGLLASLDKLSAADASRAVSGGATVAAHVDHLRYGLSLMNRWSAGDNPFKDADWSSSWRLTQVTDAEWAALRSGLRREAGSWLEALRTARDVNAVELNGIVGSIVHLAYHMGAIRQIGASARGPIEPHLAR